jgi:glutathione synthase
MRWLFVIDHLDSLNKETDTTVAVMKAARSKGIAVFWTTIEDISWEKELSASVTSFPEGKEGVEKTVNFTLIFMRKEPPYDLRFHYATELLSHAGTRVVNDPQALRDENEKLIILNFPELLPSTLVTSSRKEAEAFLSQHHSIVVKDLESYQGKGIVKATNRGELEEAFSAFGKPVMLQQFLPKVIEGDTRILLLGGKLLSAVTRIPAEGSFLSNFGKGGRAAPFTLTPAIERIISIVGPWLDAKGIHFAGLDVIDEKLTEINITCPTGVVQAAEENGEDVAGKMVEYYKKFSK